MSMIPGVVQRFVAAYAASDLICPKGNTANNGIKL